MTVHFSSRVDISAPNPIAAAEASAATAASRLANSTIPTPPVMAWRRGDSQRLRGEPAGLRRHANPGRISGDQERACSRSGTPVHCCRPHPKRIPGSSNCSATRETRCSPEARLSADRIDRRPRMRDMRSNTSCTTTAWYIEPPTSRRSSTSPKANVFGRWCSSTPTTPTGSYVKGERA